MPGTVLSPFHILTYLILVTIPGDRYQLSLECQVQTDHSMAVQEEPFAGCEQGRGPGRSWCLKRNVLRAGEKSEEIAESGQRS